MNNDFTSRQTAGELRRRRAWLLSALIACILIILLTIVRPPRHANSPFPASSNALDQSESASALTAGKPRRLSSAASPTIPQPSAEEIVAAKVSQFGRSRREIVRGISQRTQKPVPPEVEAFFDAVESGDWEQIDARWKPLAVRSGQYEYSKDPWEELNPFWPAVLDAYGAAEQAHLWPAQKLLDYGNAILESLRPGMVYVGGTDNGRWVPELLNETSGAEPHIIVTQNALADARYLEYVNTLYGERFSTLTKEDSERAFAEYTADAQKRLEHDQQFPDEPKQIRPGEDVRMVDGKVQVSGQFAVMAINEKLLQMLVQKNPELSFAVQESFPMRGTYADALPLGPLMELRAQNAENTFTAERATRSVDYWRNTAQQIMADADATGSRATMKSYSHDAVSAGNLLAAHSFATEAEQMYRLGMQFWPENPEPLAGLTELLASSGREDEAQRMIHDFERQFPGQRKELERMRKRGTIIMSAKAKEP